MIYSFDKLLIWMAKEATGQNTMEVIAFFSEQCEKMMKERENYKRSSPHYKAGPESMRLLRGFYPDTYIPFRITIVRQSENETFTSVKLGKTKAMLHIEEEELEKVILEHFVLDGEAPEIKVHKYRVTTPGDMEPLNYRGKNEKDTN